MPAIDVLCRRGVQPAPFDQPLCRLVAVAGVADKHHHRSRIVAGNAVERLQRIASRCIDIDEDHIRLVPSHFARPIGLGAEAHDHLVAGAAQRLFHLLQADGIVVDQHDPHQA